MVVTVPPSTPQNFAAISSAMTVQFSWSHPPAPSFVSNYTLTCVSLMEEVSTVTSIFTEAGHCVLDGFRPATEYSCSVFASNDVGDSTSSSRTVTTMDECTYAYSTKVTCYIYTGVVN